MSTHTSHPNVAKRLRRANGHLSKVIDMIDGDATIWEREPMERLAASGQLMAFEHNGFWQPMDTLREKTQLEALWQSRQAPWKVWP